MVNFISLAQVLPIRNVVLRNNKGIEYAHFEEDKLPNTFHLGYFLMNELVTIATFLPKNNFQNLPNGFQLRGMATLNEHSGKGFGKVLINFAIAYLKTKGIDYLWCNARQTAIGFYTKLGFEISSKPFEIENIGTHYTMTLQLI